MRKGVMAVLVGGSVLLSSMTAIAGMLTGITTVGSGLAAKLEVAADAPLTYVFFRKDATHWVVELAKTEIGAVTPVMDLSFPAATGLTAEKRQAGSVPITRLTIAVRPGVSLSVKSSADRKLLSLSFQSGSAPAAASKEDDLLGDLDAPVKSAAPGKPAAVKDDLDGLLDAPAPVAVAAPVTAPAAGAGKAAELALEAELDKPAPVAKPAVSAQVQSLDKELDAVAEPAVEPVKATLSPVVPERVRSEEPKPLEPKMVQDPLPVAPIAVAATPPALPQGVDLGALTPDEMGIAAPETAAPAPAVKREQVVAAEPTPPAEVAQVPEKTVPAAILSAGGGAGSITVNERTAEVVVNNYTTHKVFTLMDPTRLVIDLPGAKASLKEAAARARIPGIQTVRFSQYPDKVRLVFDLPKGDLPAYSIEKLENGIRVIFK